MSYLWIFLFASLAIKAKAQGFDLADALDDDVPTKAPKVPADPKKPSDGGLDLFDALLPDPKDPDPPKPKAPGDGFDLSDALGPDPEPKKPAVIPPRDGGTDGGSFGDSDLTDLIGGDSGYKPDKGKGGGHIHDPSSDYDGGRGFDDGRQKDFIDSPENTPSAPRTVTMLCKSLLNQRGKHRSSDLQSVLLGKEILRVEMETEKLRVEKEKLELEKRKLVLEIQLLQQRQPRKAD